jgi:hypothetical protein
MPAERGVERGERIVRCRQRHGEPPNEFAPAVLEIDDFDIADRRGAEPVDTLTVEQHELARRSAEDRSVE